MSKPEVNVNAGPKITASVKDDKITATVSGVGPQGAAGTTQWVGIQGKPTAFPPSAHQHVAADITDFTTAVVAVSPPATWEGLTGKPELFPPEAHAAQHGSSGSDPITVAASQISGGSLPTGAVLDFSNGTSDAEVGPWGFGVEVTADSQINTTVEPSAVTVHSSTGYAALQSQAVYFSNGTSLAVGTFDTSRGGYKGISLVCAVGYELNWQAGYLRAVNGDGSTRNVMVESPLEFPGEGVANVQIDATGLTFADGSQQTVAWTGSYAHNHDDRYYTESEVDTLLSGKATPGDISTAVSALVNSAPSTLDTLKELADALGSDANFSTTVTNSLAAKAPINNPTFTGTVSGITKGMVGLGNVDNTSDASKPVSTAQAAADSAVASAAAADATSKANAAQAAAVQRANHTGTQTASTISDFSTAASAAAPVQSVAGRTGTVTIAAADVSGLGSLATQSSVAYSSLTGTPSAFSPTAHKSSHATGGSDALSPSDIGAAAVSHTHSATAITGLAAVATSGAYGDLTGTPAAYSLPTASGSVLGGVKVGSGLSIDGSGVLTATYSYTLPNATTSTLGGVIVGTGLGVSSGTVSVTYGTTSGTACQGNDSRLSDTRTPTDGSVTDAKITSGGLSTSALNWAAIAPWQPSTAYNKGDLVSYLGVGYRRSAAGTSGAVFSGSANWQQITPSSFVPGQLGTGSPSASNWLRGDGAWTALAASATTDTTSASNISAGTLAYARMADPTVTSPSQITGSQNDYASFARGINRFTTNAAYNLTGMVAGNAGEVRVLTNVGSTAANTLTIKHLSSSSSAANQFSTAWAGDCVIAAGASVVVYYDGTSSLWRVL